MPYHSLVLHASSCSNSSIYRWVASYRPMNKVEGFHTTHHMKMSKKFWKYIAGARRGGFAKLQMT